MSYTSTFVAAFGAAGLTIHGQLYNSNGSTNGAAITSGVNEVGSSGTYIYDATIPESHRGMFRLYDSNNTSVFLDFAVSPQDTEPVPSAAEIAALIAAEYSTIAILSDLTTTGALNLRTHTTREFTLSGTIPATYTELIFTIKSLHCESDADAIIQAKYVVATGGTDHLVTLNGAAGTASWLTMTPDQPGGECAVKITDDAMALVQPSTELIYDLKWLDSSSDSGIVAEGDCSVLLVVTREI